MGTTGTKSRLTAALVLAVAALCALAPAALAGPVDIRGEWTGYACTSGTLAACESHPEFPQKYKIETEDFATGAITGQGGPPSEHYVISGTVSGCTVKVHDYEFNFAPTYQSDSVLTISADGKRLAGTFNDTFGRKEDPTFSVRVTPGPGCGTETEAERIAKEKEAGAKHPTGTQVICNYEFATAQNTCTASVGDGAPTPTTPSGTVTFTTTSGGFASGAKCSLQVVPTSPSIASCQLVYFTLYSGLPSITASYSGDATHAASSGKTQYLGGGAPEETVGSEAGAMAGEFAGELVVETHSPAAGAEAEAAVQATVSPPAPVPLGLPRLEGPLGSEAAGDLLRTESLAMLVDLGGAQDQGKIAEMDQALDKLTTQAQELMKSPSAAQQAEGQKLMHEAAETTEAITGMLKRQAEVQQAIIRGGGAVESSEKSLDAKLTEALGQLGSGNPATELKAQSEIEAAQKRLEALSKVIQKRGELSKEVIKGIGTKASVAARRGVKIDSRRVRPLGRATLKTSAPGKVTLKVKLSRTGLRALAGRHLSVAAILRVNLRLPSGTVHGGVPRSVVKRVTLKRAAGRKKK